MKALRWYNSNRKTHPGGWTVYFTRLGVLRPRWYQPLYEAWLVLTGRESLHRAWQSGMDFGTAKEYERIIENWGDLGPILNRTINVTRTSVVNNLTNNEILAQVARQIYEERKCQQ